MNVRTLLLVLAACSGESPSGEAPALNPQPVGITTPSEVTPSEVTPPEPAEAPIATADPEEAPVTGDLADDNVAATDEEREAAAALSAALMDSVAEETGVPQDEVTGLIEGITSSAPTATDEDRRAFRPRSARPGRADVESSCNTISFAAECMETARTATGQGYRSTEPRCVNGIWSTTDPCPEAGRTGTCRITEDQQVVHYYYSPSDRDPDPLVRARRVCEGYHGEFFVPRTPPLNARR